MPSSYPQIIPRPPDWAPGRPAPWSHLLDADLRLLSLERVRRGLTRLALDQPPPEIPQPRGSDIEVLDALRPVAVMRPSAVLIVLFEEAGESHVVLTRRSTRLRNHRGEISFPGGRLDDGETSTEAAVREAHEEVGLDPSKVLVIGHLPSIVTVASGSLIQPVIAMTEGRPVLVASPDEVDRVFDVALCDLLRPGVFHEERWRRPERPSPRSADGSFPLWFFEISGEMIWGATGRLLVDLLCASIPVERDLDP